MERFEVKESAVSELPPDLNQEVRRLIPDGERILSCIFYEMIDKGWIFRNILAQGCYLITGRRCVCVQGNPSFGGIIGVQYCELANVSNIAYDGSPSFTVRVQSTGQESLHFRFTTQLLAHRFMQALDDAKAAATPTADATARRLKELSRLLEENLIDLAEYNNARKRILDEL